MASPSSGPLAATSPDSQQTVQIVQNGLINSVVEDNGRVTDPNARFYQGTTPVVSSQESAVGKVSCVWHIFSRLWKYTGFFLSKCVKL